MAIEIGKAAPAFSLPDANGSRVALIDLRGKNVVLFFYPEDDTPTCTKEACAFRDVWKDLKKADTVLLGVSPDSAESHKNFAAKHRLPFTLLSDLDRKVLTAYGAWGEKNLYGKIVTGVIRSTVWIGPDGKVRKHWARVRDAEKHPDEVIKALAGA